MKFFVFKGKKVILIACLCVVLCLAIVANFGIVVSKSTAATSRKLPIYSVQKDEKIASLSFDAAWGNEDTQTLIDILGKYNVKATFFVVGGWVDKYPESVKALSDAGHEIMNHSNKHPHMPKLSREQMAMEISTCADKIEKITGVRPTLFRPPYGDYDNATIEVCEQQSHFCIQWDVDSLDWKNYSSADISARVLKKVKPGSIMLFHNAAINTPGALPSIIEGLQKDGYTLVPISQLIYKENYTMDHTGKQVPNN